MKQSGLHILTTPTFVLANIHKNLSRFPARLRDAIGKRLLGGEESLFIEGSLSSIEWYLLQSMHAELMRDCGLMVAYIDVTDNLPKSATFNINPQNKEIQKLYKTMPENISYKFMWAIWFKRKTVKLESLTAFESGWLLTGMHQMLKSGVNVSSMIH